MLDIFVPMKFPMSSQCVPQYIHNSASPSPICFTRCCPLGTYIGGQNVKIYAFQCLVCFLKHHHDPCEKAIPPYLGLGFSASFAYFWVRIQLSSQPEFPAKAEPIAILFIPEKDGLSMNLEVHPTVFSLPEKFRQLVFKLRKQWFLGFSIGIS